MKKNFILKIQDINVGTCRPIHQNQKKKKKVAKNDSTGGGETKNNRQKS